MSIFFLVGIIQYYPFLSHIKNVRTFYLKRAHGV